MNINNERQAGKRTEWKSRKASTGGEKRASLREVVAAIDEDILHLLLRRHNLLEKMRGQNRSLNAQEEKFLRESWQRAVSKISRDPELSGHFFTLMQGLEFLPKPPDLTAKDIAAGATSTATRKEAFNLAPAHSPVRMKMIAPLSSWSVRAWLYLAAASGSPLDLAPCLLNDAEYAFIKALNQMGAPVSRETEKSAISSRSSMPMGAPDKVIHVGDSAWNFFLLLAHYVGRPSKAKFAGDISLKLADLRPCANFLTKLGARLTHLVPHNFGLPVRVECSGILPDEITFTNDLPVQMIEAVLLAANFYDQAMRLDFSRHDHAPEIAAHILPLYKAIKANATLSDNCLSLNPRAAQVPQFPQIPAEAAVASSFLVLPAILGGTVELEGIWPQWPHSLAFLKILTDCGLPITYAHNRLCCAMPAPLATAGKRPDFSKTPCGQELAPIALALLSALAMHDHKPLVPRVISETLSSDDLKDFLDIAGLELNDENILSKAEVPAETKIHRDAIWNAPSATWAIALALLACARPKASSGFKLGNPGVITELYPSFWTLYNSLPTPELKSQRKPTQNPAQRRRIRTAIPAALPEMPEEDN